MVKAKDGKPRSEQRRATTNLQKRVTPAEKADFEDRASKAGYDSANAYLEAFILGRETVARRDRQDLIKILGELGKQGSNLNQLARAVNEGRITNLSPDQLKWVMAAINSARNAVMTRAQELRERLS